MSIQCSFWNVVPVLTSRPNMRVRVCAGAAVCMQARAAEGSSPSILRDTVLLKPGSTAFDVFNVLKKPPFQVRWGVTPWHNRVACTDSAASRLVLDTLGSLVQSRDLLDGVAVSTCQHHHASLHFVYKRNVWFWEEFDACGLFSDPPVT